METKVQDHLAAVRRRCQEAQEFAALASAYTQDPVDWGMLEIVESNLEEVRMASYSALKEMNEIRSYLGMPRERYK